MTRDQSVHLAAKNTHVREIRGVPSEGLERCLAIEGRGGGTIPHVTSGVDGFSPETYRHAGMNHHCVGHLENCAVHSLRDTVLLGRVRSGPLSKRAVCSEMCLELKRSVLSTVVGAKGANTTVVCSVEAFETHVGVETVGLVGYAVGVHVASTVINETQEIGGITNGRSRDRSSQVRVDEVERTIGPGATIIGELGLVNFGGRTGLAEERVRRDMHAQYVLVLGRILHGRCMQMSEAGVPGGVRVGRAEIGLVRTVWSWSGVEVILTLLQSSSGADSVVSSNCASLFVENHSVPFIRQLTDWQQIVLKVRYQQTVVDGEKLGLAMGETSAGGDISLAWSCTLVVICKVNNCVREREVPKVPAESGHVCGSSRVHDPPFTYRLRRCWVPIDVPWVPIAVVAVVDGKSVLSEWMSIGFQGDTCCGWHGGEHDKQ
jgi:hypothetical protein